MAIIVRRDRSREELEENFRCSGPSRQIKFSLTSIVGVVKRAMTLQPQVNRQFNSFIVILTKRASAARVELVKVAIYRALRCDYFLVPFIVINGS